MDNPLYAIGTILGTALLLVVRDLRDGKSIFRKNDGESLMRELKQHYNDETTVVLISIKERLDYLSGKIDDMLINGVRARK